MLNKFDDFPVHQTAEPLAHPATSDPNFYDRTWFNGYAKDGSWYFGIGMAVYPHLGILDCAFSVIEKGGRQHCFYGSCRAPLERTEMKVGPFSIEVLEPMRRTRVVLEDNKTGISCDLTFSTRTAGIEEARQTIWSGSRRVMDATRFDQFGEWSGEVNYPDGKIRVEAAQCHGTKDRSWGVRNLGKSGPVGAPQPPSSFFLLWAPLFWDDHVSLAIFFEGSSGEGLCREGLTAPLYPSTAEVPEGDDPGITNMPGLAHRLEYVPGTRLIASAEIDMINLQGDTRTISFEPLFKFQMKGLGYFHPVWCQGVWQGEMEIGGEVFDPETLDPNDASNLHVQQIVRVTDGTQSGMGVLEHACLGPYKPYGFTDFTTGNASL
ncbi:MAG: hypothetical protein DRR06_06140 [Gammaproteobacteria bacterium]|nr:MAG: hypothetical protein DRR06_06140 [Gammaproteobacteria bacterium]RLA46299.1 MAG: hypothetical protein DRR42_18530 [Gammaproteobacteria bacterium]